MEITSRTFQSQQFMVPTDEVRGEIERCLGRALHLHPVQLHGYVFMSNHFHLLLTPPSADVLADFMQSLKSLIAMRIGPLANWVGTFWGGRYHSAPIIDDVSETRCMKYLLSHGCKECLVETPQQWPGASSVMAFLDNSVLNVEWIDRGRLKAARRRNQDPSAVKLSDYRSEYEIRLTPMRSWARLGAAGRRSAARTLIEEIVREARRANVAANRHPLGVDRILSKDPLTAPVRTKRRYQPLVHAATSTARREHLVLRRAQVNAARSAVRRLEEGVPVQLPEAVFLPPRLRLPHLRSRPPTTPTPVSVEVAA